MLLLGGQNSTSKFLLVSYNVASKYVLASFLTPCTMMYHHRLVFCGKEINFFNKLFKYFKNLLLIVMEKHAYDPIGKAEHLGETMEKQLV